MASRNHDSNGYCWPSLGLGNTAGAEILEGAPLWGVVGVVVVVLVAVVVVLVLVLSN